MSERKEHDQQADAPEPPRRPVRMCVRCQAVTEDPTVVYEVHQNTGPGFNVYACEACAPLFPPAPDVFAFLPVRRRPAEGDR
ncbi:hypothetical protein ACWD01_16300 [Streptomyces sp. NPDC002835]